MFKNSVAIAATTLGLTIIGFPLTANAQANLLVRLDPGWRLDSVGELTLNDSHRITRYGYGRNAAGILGTHEFISSGSWKADNGDLGVKVEAEGNGGWAYSPQGGGEIFLRWHDSISLVPGAVPTPFPNNPNPSQSNNFSSTLIFNFDLDGYLLTTGYGSAYARVDFNYNDTMASYYASRGDDIYISEEVSSNLSLNHKGEATFSYGLRVDASSSFGSAIANLGNTLTLDSVTFEDGTTPESNGYELVFESGMSSPNISQPIPEPLSILGAGTAIIFGSAFKRKLTQKRIKQS